VGLRFTLTRRNYEALPEIFTFVEQEGIGRVCFYHLVYSGRGSRIAKDDLSYDDTRRALDLILHETAARNRQGNRVDVLTVDNHVDGVYVYLTLLKERKPHARQTWEWKGVCGGSFRVRALQVAGDPWAPDPACDLTDEEIA